MCRRRFRCVTMDFLGVRSLIEHNNIILFWKLEVLKVYRSWDISVYVMRYVHVMSGPSLLTRFTNLVIMIYIYTCRYIIYRIIQDAQYLCMTLPFHDKHHIVFETAAQLMDQASVFEPGFTHSRKPNHSKCNPNARICKHLPALHFHYKHCISSQSPNVTNHST